MHRPTTRFRIALPIITLIILPMISSARAPEREPLDLSIIEQSEQLLPYMSGSQRLQFVEIEQRIEQAESDLRSGRHLAETKPSSFDPDRDVQSTIKRGEELIAKAEAELYENQKSLIELLQTINVQRTQQQANDRVKFNYELETMAFDEALEPSLRALLEQCWSQGYETLFFDCAYVQSESGTFCALSAIRDSVYDTLLKVDGTNFSVTVPINFKLKPDTNGTSMRIFEYENASIFSDDKKALLAIELIAPQSSSTGLLSLRAIDMGTQQVAAFELVKITDIPSLLSRESEGTEDQIHDAINLGGNTQAIDVLAGLQTPYSFEIHTDYPTTVQSNLLAYTLFNNSQLILTDGLYIERAYGYGLNEPDSWIGRANAKITLDGDSDASSYQLVAKANNSDRNLPIGELKLAHLPEE